MVKSGYIYNLADVKHLIEQRNAKLPNKRVYLVDDTFVMYSKKATLTCDHGHTWEARLNDIINREAGCPYCAGSVSRETDVAIEHIKAVHPNIKILGAMGQTLGRREAFEAGCEQGHTWMATYERLVAGHYCPHCANRAKYTQEQFVERMAANNPGVTVIGEYTGMNKRVGIKCNACGHQWNPTAQRVHEGGGCPMCAINNKFSKKAMEWLTSIEQQQSITIQHAQQNGEFRIPGTRFRVDGYDPNTKTVYEFYGDYWHGNPKKHQPDGINTHLQLTYGELYESTLSREQQIRDLGYNVVSIWEMDYDRMTTQP